MKEGKRRGEDEETTVGGREQWGEGKGMEKERKGKRGAPSKKAANQTQETKNAQPLFVILPSPQPSYVRLLRVILQVL